MMPSTRTYKIGCGALDSSRISTSKGRFNDCGSLIIIDPLGVAPPSENLKKYGFIAYDNYKALTRLISGSTSKCEIITNNEDHPHRKDQNNDLLYLLHTAKDHLLAAHKAD